MFKVFSKRKSKFFCVFSVFFTQKGKNARSFCGEAVSARPSQTGLLVALKASTLPPFIILSRYRRPQGWGGELIQTKSIAAPPMGMDASLSDPLRDFLPSTAG